MYARTGEENTFTQAIVRLSLSKRTCGTLQFPSTRFAGTGGRCIASDRICTTTESSIRFLPCSPQNVISSQVKEGEINKNQVTLAVCAGKELAPSDTIAALTVLQR
ncbi:hypothetical protein BaRGS_00001019 [Batillaria attramentaria]|uniref:Uncharacterized protein n=1 Tax=Batillaria attramentaria TaxID=370345 RepID=A0ABD0M884_9CAEN